MPRIRSIKPEMFSDEKLASLSVLTRFVFVGLISMADDAGRVLDNLKIIDAFLFPETPETARRSLDELSSIGRIRRGTTAAGQRIIEITNWARHQRIDRANLVRSLPEIVTEAAEIASLTGSRRTLDEFSTNPRRATRDTFDEDSSIDREGEGEKEREKEQEQQPRAGARETAPAAAGQDDPGTQLTADALALTVAANLALNARYGDTPNLLVPTGGAAHTVARDLRDAGIPVAFAQGVIAEVAARANPEKRPKSLAYFTPAIREAWAQHAAREAIRNAPVTAPPNAAPAPVEYTPEYVAKRAHFFRWLCVSERSWAHLSPERRQADVPYLRSKGVLPDETQFLREWQVIKPLFEGDKLEAFSDLSPEALLQLFRETLADAAARGALGSPSGAEVTA